MARNLIQPKLSNQISPCMISVGRNLHLTPLFKSTLFLLPSQFPLLYSGKTIHSDHHIHTSQKHVHSTHGFRPSHNTHPRSSRTHLLRTSSVSSYLLSNSILKSSSCSTRSFHQSFHHQNVSETKTTTSSWVRPTIKSLHQPTRDIAFTEKILETVCPPSGSVVLDFTFGSGAHTEGILKRNPGVKVIAVDRDPVTKTRANELKALYPNRLCFLNIKFSEIADTLHSLGVPRSSLWGAVLDAGPSYEQLTQPERGGFCPTATGKLDLRMDGISSKSISALDVLQFIDCDSLTKVLRTYGQVKQASKMAGAIIQARYEMIDIRTSSDLVNFLSGVVGDHNSGETEDQQDEQLKSPSTRNFAHSENVIPTAVGRVFQALRILVNDELCELDCAMRVAHYLLRPNAPFAVITYNMLEHTIIKRHFAGKNVDASVDNIGRRQHSKEAAKAEDSCPWHPQDMMVTRWGQPIKHPQWKKGELRLARKNGNAVYDTQKSA